MICLMVSLLSIHAQNKPFPQGMDFPGCIKPQVDPGLMNQQVQDYYDYWKAKYVKKTYRIPGGYYVNGEVGGDSMFMSTSDLHTKGMVIAAVMGDKDLFDGLYTVYDAFRSINDHDCMSWGIPGSEQQEHLDTSQTEGDLNLAYALLIADNQWGSTGMIDYYSEAHRLIQDGIKSSEISPATLKVMLGDWGRWFNRHNVDTTADEHVTRPNDWMTANLRTFYNATEDTTWLKVVDVIFALTSHMTGNYAPNTGLLPDFVIDNPPVPAPPNYLESAHDGDFSWNSALFPMHMALDYAHSGDQRAKDALLKVVNWVKSKHGHPQDIMAGYTLDGQLLPDLMFPSMLFTAPLITASIVDPAHQEYLDQGWAMMVIEKSGVFEDTVNLFCQLIISGNLWEPGNFTVVPPTPTPVPPISYQNVIINGDFSDATGAHWDFEKVGSGTGTISIVNGELKCSTVEAGTSFKIMQHGLGMVQGNHYYINFSYRADAPDKTITVRLYSRNDPWKVYSEMKTFPLSGNMMQYSTSIDMVSWTDYDIVIQIDVGSENTTFYIDDVELFKLGDTLVDLAVNKPVFSSGDYAPQFGKTNINDDNDTTVWGSKLATTGNQWIYIDLQNVYQIDEVVINWFGEYYARNYSIGFTDGVNPWELIPRSKISPGPDKITTSKQARYVGILCTKANSIAYGISTFSIMGYE